MAIQFQNLGIDTPPDSEWFKALNRTCTAQVQVLIFRLIFSHTGQAIHRHLYTCVQEYTGIEIQESNRCQKRPKFG